MLNNPAKILSSKRSLGGRSIKAKTKRMQPYATVIPSYTLCLRLVRYVKAGI